MILNFILYFLVISWSTTTHGFPRYRRQAHPQNINHVPPQGDRSAWISHPSGSIPGTYYYGVGSDPNYGSFIKFPNRPNSGILAISYNPDSSLSNYLINPNRPPGIQSSYQQYPYNNNNNNQAWQRPNQYNRYPPGTQGWYASGGNYWHNKAQSLCLHSYVFIQSIFILIIFH